MAGLDALIQVRSALATAVLAYLRYEEDEAALLPHYFPERLRTRVDGRSGFDALRQRVRVSSWATLGKGHPRQPASRSGAPDFSRRVRGDSESVDTTIGEDLEAPRWDELAHSARAIIVGDAGAGKSWLLRCEDSRLARGSWQRLNGREAPLKDIVLPVRLHLSELSGIRELETASIAEVLVAAVVELVKRQMPRYDRVKLPVLESLRAWVLGRLSSGNFTAFLDAWDEVLAQHDQLRPRLKVFTDQFPKVRIILTTRDQGFERSRPPLVQADEFGLLALDPQAIDAFCDTWFERHSDAGARSTLAVSLKDPALRELSRNPLMLTLICRVAEQRVRSNPARRAELYNRCVSGLLWDWKTEDGKRRAEAYLPSAGAPMALPLAGPAYVSAMLDVMAPVALRLFTEVPPYAQSRVQRLVAEEQDRLPPSHPFASARCSWDQILAAFKGDGLLVPTGPHAHADVAFFHRTVHEYLAAIAMALPVLAVQLSTHPQVDSALQASTREFVDALHNRVGDPRWQDVVKLAFGYVGLVQTELARGDGPAIVGGTMVELLKTVHGPPGEVAALVGAAAAEVSPGVHSVALESSVRPALINTMRDDGPSRVPVRTRAAAGTALGRIGDPRFHGPGLWCLPARLPSDEPDPMFGFIEIPAGSFIMGSDPQKDFFAFADELHQHKRRIEQRYWVGRYPVTVGQFQVFAETPEGQAHMQGDRRCLDAVWNHPVVWVSWYDAQAYCAWLTTCLEQSRDTAVADLQGLLRSGYRVSMPTETEWERAARGTDGRTYPWGTEFDQNLVNCLDGKKSAIQDTSAVGCFPSGAGASKAEDMAGNVWEWTQSQWTASHWEPLGRFDTRCVSRGGSFGNRRVGVRAACRSGDFPMIRNDRLGFRVALCPFRS